MDRSEMLDNLADRISGIHRTHPVRVAIDGPTAAGKTTLADELVVPLEARGRAVLRASIDGFHHPRSHRYRNGADYRAYYHDSFDYLAIRRYILEPLGPRGGRCYVPAVFDFRTDSPVAHRPCEAPADAILLFDGVMLLREELRDYWDYRLFVQIDTHTAAERTARRDAERQGGASKARDAYLGRYMPGQQHYVREAQPHRQADAVVVNDHPDQPALLIGAKRELAEKHDRQE